MPDGDGPVPDLLITSADLDEHPRGLPAGYVHTVFEVVSPSNAATDRVIKTELYAEAGIPCYWRIELRAWREHFGPVPAIVVRLRGEDGQWRQTIAPAGAVAELPVVVNAAGTTVPVKIDPATLVGQRTT
jgi:Uma2 family endonuclease